MAVSDIALKKPLPPEIGQDLLAWVGCIAGAIPIGDYEQQLREAGFAAVQVVDTYRDLNAYAQAGASACCSAPPAEANAAPCCSTPAGDGLHERLAQLLARYDVNEFAASVQVYAIKA